MTISCIAREISKKKGKLGWDGISKTDKENQSILKKVSSENKKVKNNSIDIDTLEIMKASESKNFLKRRHTSIHLRNRELNASGVK